MRRGETGKASFIIQGGTLPCPLVEDYPVMVIKIENAKRSYSTWMLVLRIGVTAAFFFWFYIIWNSTSDLDQKLSVVTAQYSAIDDLQIDYKNEIQECVDN